MYVPILFTIWIAVPAFVILIAYFPTDIIDGVCVPYGAYSSVAEEKTSAFFLFFVTYLQPLMLMIFCYSRIVYTLRTKVIKRHYGHSEFCTVSKKLHPFCFSNSLVECKPIFIIARQHTDARY